MKTIYKIFTIFLLIGFALMNLQAQNRAILFADATSGSANSGVATTAIIMSVIPAVWNFGNVAAGLTPIHNIIVSNAITSTDPLIITPGSLPAPFSVMPPGTISISPGSTQTLAVTFTPTTAGAFIQTFDIANNSTNLPQPYPVTLKGTATASGIIMSITPVTLNFGNVATGLSPSQSVIISNSSASTGPLKISWASLMIPYTVISNPGAEEIQPGHSESFKITFSPTAIGTFNQTVAVANNSTNFPGTKNVVLKGNGIKGEQINMSVNQVTWNFGNVNLGQAPTHSFTVTNAATSTGNLEVSWANLPAPFSVNAFVSPGSILPGHSETYTITFNPNSVGTFNETWSMINNSTNFSPAKNIVLKGNGIAGSQINMAVSPASWNFSNIHIGHPVTHNIQVSNLATSNGSLIVSWTNLPAPFTVNPPVSAGPILPGHHETFTITFTPVDGTIYDQMWGIINNSTNVLPTYPVNLKGQGY